MLAEHKVIMLDYLVGIFSLSVCVCVPKGGRGVSDVPPCKESQGCQFDLAFLSPLLFFCLVMSLCLSYHFLLLAHSLDLVFSKPSIFRRVGFFVWLLSFFFFERLGDENFSCWYNNTVYFLCAHSGIKQALGACAAYAPYGTAILELAFMHL